MDVVDTCHRVLFNAIRVSKTRWICMIPMPFRMETTNFCFELAAMLDLAVHLCNYAIVSTKRFGLSIRVNRMTFVNQTARVLLNA